MLTNPCLPPAGVEALLRHGADPDEELALLALPTAGRLQELVGGSAVAASPKGWQPTNPKDPHPAAAAAAVAAAPEAGAVLRATPLVLALALCHDDAGL